MPHKDPIARREYQRRRRAAKRDELRVYYAVYREANRETLRANNQRSQRKLKQEVIDGYGGQCACCGEVELVFLCIDHIDGQIPDEHRSTQTRNGRKCSRDIYKWLRDAGFPDGYRVLCWNCNSAIGLYGVCPHSLADKAPTL